MREVHYLIYVCTQACTCLGVCVHLYKALAKVERRHQSNHLECDGAAEDTPVIETVTTSSSERVVVFGGAKLPQYKSRDMRTDGPSVERLNVVAPLWTT